MIGTAFGILLAFASADRAVLDWGALVASAETDPQVVAARSQLKELQGVSLLAWDKLSAKWNVKRADFKEIEYDLRLAPTAWGERSANRSTWEARRTRTAARADLVHSDAVLDRLLTGLMWVHKLKETTYHEAMRSLYDARLQAMSKIVGDSRFDPRDLVRTQLRRTETEAEIMANRQSIDALERRLATLAPGAGPIALDTHLISLGRVLQVVETLGRDSGTTALEVAIAASDLALAGGEENLERTRSNRWLDYLQVGWTYEAPSTLSNRDRASSRWRNYSAEVGFVLPFFDGSGQDRARKLSALADARGEHLQERRDFERKVEVSRMEIASLVRQRAVLDSLTAKVDAGALFSAYALRSGGDPLLVLQAKEASLESSWSSEKLRFEILERYLDLLHVAGGLRTAKDPLVGD